ncbi:MAG: RNA polymerase sigma factor [Acidobacteria bacterium]|nr:RNA polymerase sigma factor [Acidobacteriota bacterium]
MSSSAARYFPDSLRKGIAASPTIRRNASTLQSAADTSEHADGVSDEALVARISTKDAEALALLFRRYGRVVRSVALRILRDGAEADDLLQDVFLLIYRKAGQFDPSKCPARSWIVQITYHRAFDRRRALQSRHFYTQVDLNEAASAIDSWSNGTDGSEMLRELVGNTTMQGLLDILTEDQRNTLSLHFYEGYTFAEIAAKLDQPVGNIRNHYYRGLEKLRKQIFPGKLPGHNGYGRK